MQVEELIAVKVTLTAIPVFFLAIAIELIGQIFRQSQCQAA